MLGAIGGTINIVETAGIATSIKPNHRHASGMAGDIEGGDTPITNNNSEQGSAFVVRRREEDLAASTADVFKHRAFRDDTGLLDEGHVPSKVGYIGATSLEGSDVDRQNYGARAGASSLTEEDLAPIASLCTTSRTSEHNVIRRPINARIRGNGQPRTISRPRRHHANGSTR